MDKTTQEIIKVPYYIYGLSSSENVDNIRYIGYTNKPETRLSEHLRDCTRKNVKTHKKNWISEELLNNNKIHLIILKEVETQEEAKKEEIEYIKKYTSFGVRLVNGTKGGDGVVATEEVRKKISESNKGKKHSLEAIEKIKLANLGRKHSEETLKKMRETRKGICTRKPWTEEQRLLKSQYMKDNPIPRDNNPMTNEIKAKISNTKKGVPSKKRKIVLQMTIDGNIVKEFESLTEATKQTKINNIYRCILGKRKTAGTFIWKYKN